MPERDGYILGVPCWVDTPQPDPEAALPFYRGLFGWEFENVMPAGSEGKYFIGRLRGGDVAAVGSTPDGAPAVAMWNTYVWVASADETATKARAAGGGVAVEPFDVMDAGRMAVLTDPEGAAFCVWQAKDNKGAQVVNEARSPTPARWSVPFAAGAAEAAAAKAPQLGGTVVAGPSDAPWARLAVIPDPQGATFIASQFVPENKALTA